MKISEIYERYKIMPNLQEHMFRVAGVAYIICDDLQEPIDKDSVTAACLLHDIGNIIKFDLERFPEILKLHGYDYWNNVKQEFIKKYGKDEHYATYQMIAEIGPKNKVQDLVKNIGFSKAKYAYNTENFGRKIASYSDMRVSPYGVTSLEKRLSEVKKRYARNIKAIHIHSPDSFDYLSSVWSSVEKQIFLRCKIRPEDISEEKVKPLIEKLKYFNIETK